MPDIQEAPSAPMPPQEAQQVPQPNEALKKKNKKFGLFWIFGPLVILLVVLTLWAVSAFIAGRLIPIGMSGGATVVFQLVNLILGFIAFLSVILEIIGIPVGICYLAKRAPYDPSACDPRSGEGNASTIPPEILGWNWAAFSLSIIWGLCHRVWISLLCFIPVVGFVVSIYLGIKGNELAWKKDKWLSVDEFRSVQKKWQPWGIVFFILWILAAIGRSNGIYQKNAMYDQRGYPKGNPPLIQSR